MKTQRFLPNSATATWIIILGALFLRCLFLDTRGIWYDDAFSMLLGRQDLSSIIAGTAADTMPPLYYFLLHFWMKISGEIWWCRILSVLLSLGGMAFLYGAVSDMAGEKIARWAILWAAVSPFQIYHAQEMRMYTLLQFSQVLYIYFFIKIYQSKKTNMWLWLGFILGGLISLYTHNLAVFFLPIPDLFLAVKKQWKMLGKVIISQGVILFLFLPWLLLVPGQIQKIQAAFWTPTPGLLELVQSGVDFVGSLYPTGILLTVVSSISLIILLLVFVGFFRLKTITHDQKIFFGLLVFLVPLELLAASFLMRPIYVTRGFITSILFFTGVAALVIGGLENRTVKYFLGFSAILVAVLALPSQYLYNQFPRSLFEQAIQDISSQENETAIILHDNKLSFLPGYVYFPEVPQVFLADTPGSSNDTFAVESQNAMGVKPVNSIEEAVRDHGEVYFVVFEKTIQDYLNIGIKTHPLLDWFGNNYRLVEQKSYQDLLVYHYLK